MPRPEQDNGYFLVDREAWDWMQGKVNARQIQPTDMSVLFSVMSKSNRMTGAYYGTVAAALTLDWSPQTIANSVSRLKKADLLKRFKDKKNGLYWYACNPRLTWTGPTDARQRLWQKWRSEAD